MIKADYVKSAGHWEEEIDFCPYCGEKVYKIDHYFAFCDHCGRHFAVMAEDEEEDKRHGRDHDGNRD